jgi:hypothetical protein
MFGPVTDSTPEAVPCRLVTKRRQVTDALGNLVVSEAQAEFPPEVNDIPIGSEVTVDGTTYQVVRTSRPRGPGNHVTGLEVLLTQGG